MNTRTHTQINKLQLQSREKGYSKFTNKKEKAYEYDGIMTGIYIVDEKKVVPCRKVYYYDNETPQSD